MRPTPALQKTSVLPVLYRCLFEGYSLTRIFGSENRILYLSMGLELKDKYSIHT